MNSILYWQCFRKVSLFVTRMTLVFRYVSRVSLDIIGVIDIDIALQCGTIGGYLILYTVGNLLHIMCLGRGVFANEAMPAMAYNIMPTLIGSSG